MFSFLLGVGRGCLFGFSGLVGSFPKTKHFPMYTHNQYHCVQEPLKGFISPDSNADEDSGVAASLFFTIKRPYCIKGFD